ncbi:G protein-activated inward rectifier potassium channel 4-like [Trichoplusia ni]|uniref:G protein-activated inward rectifier potassium channel 4-like n=1 Tax=Trichoplusia ni TaxID=7111 RepID=A0A7E5V9G3_TRINI|nr:G protein-activated inward rectifier potassium channel 4-like [Trichoplusia ni]
MKMNVTEKEQLIAIQPSNLEEVENGTGGETNKNQRLCRNHQKRISGRKKPNRAVFKTGHFNLERWKKSKYHVFPDIVQAFIDAQWRWTILHCILTYLIIWLTFTGIWWVILDLHGDFEPEHLPNALNSTEWLPCVKEIYGFTSLFLFSIEIHTTIGYGKRSITLECPSAMVTMCIESIIGTISQAFIIGIVFAKLTRPKNRAQTLLFSKNAVINQRDRNLCLVFRFGNTRKSRIIAGNVHAYLLRHSSTELLENQIKLELSLDSSENISFLFPVFAVHKIDESSPLYSMSASDLLKAEMEIIVVFEGTIESTGQPVQVKSSYTAQEILWGHRFVNMIEYLEYKHGFEIDYSKFDETNSVNTPLCSARRLNIYYKNK